MPLDDDPHREKHPSWIRNRDNSRVVGKSDREPGLSVRRLDSNFVVNSTTNPLFAAQIPFGCLNGKVSEQELDLLQLASGRMAKPSASPAEVVWR